MSQLPSGTVTFLFTDIEGSTRRWEAYPTEMRAALARHDAILRSAIEANGGFVFKTVGDAFCAAFATADEALRAALAAQHALCSEQWPQETGPIGVRMALHTGAVNLQECDYFGQPVNRVARILSAGHGGQVLLSSATFDLVRDNLPRGTTLKDMGEHRLKDLTRPEHIYQFEALGLPREFPPLKTLDSRSNNLPVQLTAFVGREKDVADGCALLRRPDVHLVTFTGPGGTGKTRLALQVAAELLDDFEDGVYFVGLAALTDHRLVVSTIARMLGVSEQPGRTILDMLEGYLVDRQMLLVLDNFEQVAQAAPVVDALLRAAPRLKVLVTSRLALHLYGQKEFPVSPMSLPDTLDGNLPPAERLTQYESVRLFIERAQDVKPDFQVTNESAPAVAEICARLDGLPLAIELAAARVRLFSPVALLPRLESRLKLLTGGGINVPARQQTLRNTIEWSYDLLSAEEQKLFRRLAVFQGGRTLEAIEAVCNPAGDLGIDVLDVMESLVANSLIKQVEGRNSEPRFVMLETIHEFAVERLRESGEEAEFRGRHAELFLALAESAEPELDRKDQATWLDRLEAEHDNLRAALSWAEATGDIETGLRLAGALAYFWEVRGHFSEGLRRLLYWLDISTGQRTAARAKAAYGVGFVAQQLMELDKGRAYLLESIELFKELGDIRGQGRAICELADLEEMRPEPNVEELRALLREGLGLAEQAGDIHGAAHALNDLGEVARLVGDYSAARSLYEQSLVRSRAIGDLWYIAAACANLSNICSRFKEYAEAEALLRESVSLLYELGDKRSWAMVLGAGLAGLVARRGQLRRAARLLGVSEAMYRSYGYHLEAPDRLEFDTNVTLVRSGLGDAAFEEAWQEGQSMSLDSAIAYALKEDTGDEEPSTEPRTASRPGCGPSPSVPS